MRILLFLLFAFSTLFASAQGLNRYFIKFTDKTNTPYSINNPSQFLSQRAIDRRQVQGIAVNESDLPVDPAYVSAVAATGATVINRINWFNGVVIYAPDAQVLAAVQALPFVEQSTAVGRKKERKERAEIPIKNDVVYAAEGLKINLDYGAAANQIMLHNGQVLHNKGYTGSGKLIAVIDAGFLHVNIAPAFDRLFQNNLIVSTSDFVNPGGDVYAEHSHGTMVLSIMGGYLPGEIIGTAPDASYLLLRSEDASSEYIIEEYNWAAAAQYADSAGADVLNTSLGYTTFDDPSMNHDYASLNGDTNPITIAADMAAAKGMLVVNSAGNEGNSPWYYISSAADGDSVLAVGAIDSNGNYAGFSGKGPSSDGRIKPNIVAKGMQTTVASPWGGVIQGNGTSFSGPVIAGLAACLWQAHPQKTNMEIFDIIQRSSSQFNNPDVYRGYGIPNFALADSLLRGFDEDMLINVFPNPSADFFIFSFFSKDQQDIVIKMFDAAGREVMSRNESLHPLSYNTFYLTDNLNLSNGMYIIQVRTKNKNHFAKVIKR